MVTYSQNELMSITDFTKTISKVLNDIKDETMQKVGILKNNKLQAVVISTEEYERLKRIDEYIEAKEDEEIIKIIEQRAKTPSEEYISLEDIAKEYNIDLDNL